MAAVLPEGAGTDEDETATVPLRLLLMLDPAEDTSLDAGATEVADDRDDGFEAYPEDTETGSGTVVVKVVSVGVVRANGGKASTSYEQNVIQHCS